MRRERIAKYQVARLAQQGAEARVARYQRLSLCIARAVARDLNALEERAHAAAAALPAHHRAEVLRALEQRQPPAAELCVRAAAMVALAMTRSQDADMRARLLLALARGVDERFSTDLRGP